MRRSSARLGHKVALSTTFVSKFLTKTNTVTPLLKGWITSLRSVQNKNTLAYVIVDQEVFVEMSQRVKNGDKRNRERGIQLRERWCERAEWAGEDTDEPEEGKRDLSRRQRADGEGSDNRWVAFSSAEEIGAHYSDQRYWGRLCRHFWRGSTETAAPVHQVGLKRRRFVTLKLILCWLLFIGHEILCKILFTNTRGTIFLIKVL